ncbi:hypothetical protein [Nostoc sp.]|uniref:hypothetical protein n=1 Tax=Nostoc sp. TaxID=1180 RepID=UPI002FFC3BC2
MGNAITLSFWFIQKERSPKIIVSFGRLDPRLLKEVGDLNILGSAIAPNNHEMECAIAHTSSSHRLQQTT